LPICRYTPIRHGMISACHERVSPEVCVRWGMALLACSVLKSSWTARCLMMFGGFWGCGLS
jgi:hypothetical protein